MAERRRFLIAGIHLPMRLVRVVPCAPKPIKLREAKCREKSRPGHWRKLVQPVVDIVLLSLDKPAITGSRVCSLSEFSRGSRNTLPGGRYGQV
jgi:hypothetical protein